jgi:spore coat polysaccharide biosynthesis protein SpsF
MTRRSNGTCSTEARRLAVSAGIIVQARAASTRLPEKVLKPLGGSTLLGHIVRRLTRAGLPVWLATSENPRDDRVAAAGAEAAASVFRGSEADVLDRFARCIESMPAVPDVVVRMCADRPLACPVLVRELLDIYEAVGRPDYLANNLVKSFPDGLDVELVRTTQLLAAAEAAADAYEREHVTPYFYRRPDEFRLVNVPCAFGNFSSVRAAIDTEHDYRRLVEVERRLAKAAPDYEYRDVLTLATVEPELFP